MKGFRVLTLPLQRAMHVMYPLNPVSHFWIQCWKTTLVRYWEVLCYFVVLLSEIRMYFSLRYMHCIYFMHQTKSGL